jgi:ABC-2 type transport system ATP-binding protein
MKDLNREGKTILLSSHILSEVAQTCTHVGVIDKGKIVAVDTTEALLSRLGGGGVRCLIEAPNVPDAALRGLLDISHVKDVQRTDWGLIVTMDKDARAAVNAFLIGLGVAVMGVKLAEFTLEDAFLSLTGGGRE